MKKTRRQKTTVRSSYAAPRIEVHAAEPSTLLVATNVGGDAGIGVFGNYVGGNPGSASFGNSLSGSGSAGGASFGSGFSGGGGSAGAANLVTGAKTSDFGISFSDVWGE